MFIGITRMVQGVLEFTVKAYFNTAQKRLKMLSNRLADLLNNCILDFSVQTA